MNVHAKIGTHSQSMIRIGFKRKLPTVGDKIKFKTYPPIHGEKWRCGKIDMIKWPGYSIYFISLL